MAVQLNGTGGADDWTKVRAEEKRRVADRRAWLNGTGWECPIPDNHVGLALSGGGIRSATFSLGLMRSLSKAKLLHSVDYLSSVSGGGYAAAFYCSLFVPPHLRGSARREGCRLKREDNPANELKADVLGSAVGREAIAHLRQGGHYLAPNGTSDALFAAVIAIRNWLAVALVTGLALLATFLFLNIFVHRLETPVKDLFEGVGVAVGGPRSQHVGFWLIVLAVIGFWPLSCGLAYWFARSGNVPISRFLRLFSMQTLVAAALAALALFFWPTPWEGRHLILRSAIAFTAFASFVVYAMAELDAWRLEKETRASPATTRAEAYAQEDSVRHTLSRWLFRGVFVLLVIATFAGIHLLSDPHNLFSKWTLNLAALLIVLIVILVTVLLSRLALGRGDNPAARARVSASAMRSSRRFGALLAGLAVLLLYLKFWATIAAAPADRVINLKEEGVAALWNQMPAFVHSILAVAGYESQILPQRPLLLLLIAAGSVALIAYLAGNVDSLLNRSSLSAFYSGRLRAAYLGATNLRRWQKARRSDGHGEAGVSKAVDQEDPLDEITLDSYYCPGVVAPIHIINVTINETTNKSSRVIQRDRKGKSMTVAPSGYIFPPHSPQEPVALLRRKDAEDLPLSAWIAISGAAFSTGAGHHMTLGTAMLASLTNMRLGYWWHRTKPPRFRPRGLSTLVQSYLLREMRANFEGTQSDRWYLSDGGHHENMGVYELVRRRVPLIIASDNGADPYYQFADLVNLIRKIRIDFEAEVDFLDAAELDALFGKTPLRTVFGTLDSIRTTGKQATRAAEDPTSHQPQAGPYATLARIRYLAPTDVDTRPTTLLLIKPRITGRELPDLLQYRDANAAFPQQPTTKQFFDEAQWESYYRLGLLIGDTIFDRDRFGDVSESAWQPWNLEPLPDAVPIRSPANPDRPSCGTAAGWREAATGDRIDETAARATAGRR